MGKKKHVGKMPIEDYEKGKKKRREKPRGKNCPLETRKFFKKVVLGN